jgi:Cd2+/Zn2+-exporting ATPase
VKALFVGLTFAGMASLWGAIAADVGASLLVVANALRLLRATPLSSTTDKGRDRVVETMAIGRMTHGH